MAVSHISSPLELSEQFMAHAEAVFSFNSLSLAPDGRSVLQQDFNTGANKMGAEKRLSPEDIGQAHHAVGLYAAAIVVAARSSQTPNLNNFIYPKIIQKAKNFFCPGFWPFC